MISRTAMAWTLLTCFTASDKRMRLTILACMLIQVVMNTVGVLQMVLQCGPYPYHPVSVFKAVATKAQHANQGSGQPSGVLSLYVGRDSGRWVGEMPVSLGADDNRLRARRYGTRAQLMINVLTYAIGLNTVIDLFLAAVAAIEAWQFFIHTDNRKPGVSTWSHFRRISGSVRFHWIWQTVTFSGPLLLAGAASIVKTYVCRQ